MKRKTIFFLFVFFLFAACKEKEKDTPPPTREARKAPKPMTRKPPRRVVLKEKIPKGPSIAEYCKKKETKALPKKGKLRRHRKIARLIKSAARCKELSPKCKRFKRLKKYVNDIWMHRKDVKKTERLRAYATSIDLLLSKRKKVAAAAIQGVLNGYLYRHEWVVKNPERLPKQYIQKMIKAVSNMEKSIHMGFLIQGVAQLAPAYGLTEEVLRVAKAHLDKNKDLVRYALTNMVRYGDVCLFKYIRAHSKDPKNLKALQAAAQATNTLLKKKKTSKRHFWEMCTYSDQFVPGKFSEKLMKDWDFSGYAHRYFDVVKTCERYQTIPRVRYFLKAKSKSVKKRAKKLLDLLQEVKQQRIDAAQNK